MKVTLAVKQAREEIKKQWRQKLAWSQMVNQGKNIRMPKFTKTERKAHRALEKPVNWRRNEKMNIGFAKAGALATRNQGIQL